MHAFSMCEGHTRTHPAILTTIFEHLVDLCTVSNIPFAVCCVHLVEQFAFRGKLLCKKLQQLFLALCGLVALSLQLTFESVEFTAAACVLS